VYFSLSKRSSLCI